MGGAGQAPCSGVATLSWEEGEGGPGVDEDGEMGDEDGQGVGQQPVPAPAEPLSEEPGVDDGQLGLMVAGLRWMQGDGTVMADDYKEGYHTLQLGPRWALPCWGRRSACYLHWGLGIA